MKKTFIVVAVMAMVCALALPSLHAVDAPDGIMLDHFKAEKNNLVVPFNHSTHADLECTECHHMWDGSSEIQGCTTEGCHDVMDKKDKSANSWYKVTHDRRTELSSCVGCHKELDVVKSDKAKKKELTSCRGSACHP